MSQHQQSTPMTIALGKVNIGGGTQSRVALNEEVVSDYADVIRKGGTLPPVVVFHDGGAYWLADGFHRFHAHRQARAEDIEADVHTGTKRDAVLYSVGANAHHGLRRSNDDKRRAVQTLLDDAEWSQWSDRQIAEACGVSPPFVAAVRSPEAAQRQQINRKASASRRVESDSTHQPDQAETASTGCNPITPQPEPAEPVVTLDPGSSPASVAEVESDSTEQYEDDDVPSLESLLEEAQAFNRKLIEDLRIAEADDQAAESLKWLRAYEGSKVAREQADRRARDSEKREKATMNQLRRCGKAVGEEDQRKIAGKVEEVVKAARGAGVWE